MRLMSRPPEVEPRSSPTRTSDTVPSISTRRHILHRPRIVERMGEHEGGRPYVSASAGRRAPPPKANSAEGRPMPCPQIPERIDVEPEASASATWLAGRNADPRSPVAASAAHTTLARDDLASPPAPGLKMTESGRRATTFEMRRYRHRVGRMIDHLGQSTTRRPCRNIVPVCGTAWTDPILVIARQRRLHRRMSSSPVNAASA